jgi:hypothetical protein
LIKWTIFSNHLMFIWFYYKITQLKSLHRTVTVTLKKYTEILNKSMVKMLFLYLETYFNINTVIKIFQMNHCNWNDWNTKRNRTRREEILFWNITFCPKTPLLNCVFQKQTSRYSRERVDRNLRYCLICNTNEAEDEFHVLHMKTSDIHDCIYIRNDHRNRPSMLLNYYEVI